MDNLPNLHGAVLVVTAVVIAGIWIAEYREGLRFRARLWWARVPMIGELARVARDPHARAPIAAGASIIANGERALVSRWLPWLRPGLDRRAFANVIAYPRKAHDLAARYPQAPWLLTVALLLAIPEGWSFAFVLIPHISGNLSQDQRDLLATLIGYGLAVLFLVLAHKSGDMYRRARTAADLRNEWRSTGQVGSINPEKIGPNDQQNQDDGRPVWEMVLARAKPAGSTRVPLAMFAVVLVLGLGASALRFIATETDRAASAKFAQQLNAEQPALQAAGEALQSGAETILGFAGNAIALGIFFGSFVLVQTLGFLIGKEHAVHGEGTRAVLRQTHGQFIFEAYEERHAWYRAQIEALFTAFQSRLDVRRRSTPPMQRVIDFELAERRKGAPTAESPADPKPPATQGAIDDIDALPENVASLPGRAAAGQSGKSSKSKRAGARVLREPRTGAV